MTTEHLLPANATPLEVALSHSMDALARLALPSDAIRSFKTDPSDPLLPWLIWEYGLSELLPYLPEPRRAIADGILWQRLRGTPAALATAMTWIGGHATVEQEPPGAHFADFQLDFGAVPEDAQRLANLIAIARLSAPARARLSRIYHGWDLRRVVLDASRLGDSLLSDNSGVLWTDGQTKLSFGRQLVGMNADLQADPQVLHEAVRFGSARLIDRALLDFSRLGDGPAIRNCDILHAHLFVLFNRIGAADPAGFLPQRRFCRAMVALSEDSRLGDLNACTPRFALVEEGVPVSLGGGEPLSDTPHRMVRVEVTERIGRSHLDRVALPDRVATGQRAVQIIHPVRARSDMATGFWNLGDTPAAFDRSFLRRDHVTQYGMNPALRSTQASRASLMTQSARDTGITVVRPDLLRLSTMDAARNTDTTIRPTRAPVATGNAAWQGQTWTGTTWPVSTWNRTRELIASAHSTT